MNSETIADILKEMRRFADCHRMHGEGQATKEFADRVEAAHKREMERAERRGSHDTMKVMSETIGVVKQDFTTGNAAKMRKALEECLDELKDTYVEECDCEDCKDRKELLSRIKEALSAPPRNCDRLESRDKFVNAWNAYVPGRATAGLKRKEVRNEPVRTDA